ncbi:MULTISPECIES: DUF6299 family protein [unclassified Agromyces]|uniref:DUF6299 family protein n=1 Tax=unclassified Agromyces TaxID=2639701 RepID=UPI0030155A83
MDGLTWRQRLSALTVAALACLLFSATPAHAAAPTNDNFADAAEIAQLPFSETLDASEASAEQGEENLCNGGGASVWYLFTPDRDMSVKAEASDNITFQTVGLSLYTGTSLDALTPIACGTQSPLGYFFPQSIDFYATAGTTYFVRAAGFTGTLGTFTLDVEELIRPANDDRTNAQPVGDLPASVSADTTNATTEPGEERPCGGSTGSVWYSVTTATASDLSVRPASAGVAVYDVDGGLIGCGGPFRTVAGGTYLIQVVSYPSQGPINFEVRTYTPITGSVSVDSQATIDRFGKVTVTGTLRCTGDFGTGFNVQVTLQQQLGKQPVAEGYGFASPYTPPGQAICDGQPHAWTAIVYDSQTSTAFWTGSMTAIPSATILTDPYYFQADLSGPTSKVSAKRAK